MNTTEVEKPSTVKIKKAIIIVVILFFLLVLVRPDSDCLEWEIYWWEDNKEHVEPRGFSTKDRAEEAAKAWEKIFRHTKAISVRCKEWK